MSLEKKEVFPNLFRYVCDSCPFDWPRTPVKESDLPPPPAHSCPNENQPDLKPVLAEQERGTSESTAPKSESTGPKSESARPRPVAVCTRCSAVSYAVNLINGQCTQTIAGKRCVGVNGSAPHADDWNQCATCAGTGNIETTRCGPCDGTGWLYARSRGRR
jgi:hypothetical protein